MKFTHTHKFAPVFLLALLLTGFSPALVVGQSDKVPPVRSPAEETSPPPAQETSYHYLGRSLDQKINELDWGEGASVSLYVADLDHNLAVFEHNADQPMPPASIMKLFLAAGAIQILGPEYRFQTEMLATGEPFKQRLKGDWLKSNCLKGEVWVKGDGDPSITSSLAQNPDAAYALFDSWAAMLKSKRIHAIEGPILLDTSAFDSQGYPTGWPEENVAPPQFPEISPINFNDNCFDIYWRPTNRSEGKVAPHSIFPALPRFIHFSNNIKVLSGHNPSRKFERALGTNVISATGYILPGTKAYDRATLAHPAEYFGEALKDRLGQKGILISGSVRFGTLPAPKRGSEGAPGSKTLLPGSAAESTTPSQPAAPAPSLEIHDLHQSPPLREIIQNMLRDDRTLDAEVILKAIGRKRSGRAGTTADGAAAVMDFIRSRRLANAGFVMMDGSGMSRLNRTSARQAMGLLDLIRGSGDADRMIASFPQNGQPGPLENRFMMGVDSEAETKPKVHAIGGNLEGAQTLAGWISTRAGQPIYFTFLVSGSKLSPAELAQRMDAVLMEISRSFIR